LQKVTRLTLQQSSLEMEDEEVNRLIVGLVSGAKSLRFDEICWIVECGISVRELGLEWKERKRGGEAESEFS